MKITTEYCDRCGREMSVGSFPVGRLTAIKSIKLFGFGEYAYSESKDELCADCTKAFEKWMEDTE